MTEVEPEWDAESRAEAVLLIDLEADTCSGCGHPLSETLSPEAFGGYKTDPPARCNGCDALQRAQKEYAKAKIPHFHALRFSVRRIWKGGGGDR